MRRSLADPIAWPRSTRAAGGHHYAAGMWREFSRRGVLNEVRRTPFLEYRESAVRESVQRSMRLSPYIESWTYAVVRAAIRALCK
jgi:hypothetical protein